MIRRRNFIALLGVAAAWPLAARAQQRAMPVIGFLSLGSPGEGGAAVAAFRKGLSEMGYVEGRNVAIEFRWAQNDFSRLPELAADLVRRRVAIIFAGGTAAPLAAKALTSTIPIVFSAAGDPVQSGIVASLNRPGGNVTGISVMDSELGAKRIGLLHELLPLAERFGVLSNPGSALADREIADLRAAATAIGRDIEIFYASTNSEIDTAFAKPRAKADRGARGHSAGIVRRASRTNRHAGGATCDACDSCLSHGRCGWRADELRTDRLGR
jgi:putative ABC transport system substrate-binding protein